MVVNIIATDDLAKQGARASAAAILTLFSWIPAFESEALKLQHSQFFIKFSILAQNLECNMPGAQASVTV